MHVSVQLLGGTGCFAVAGKENPTTDSHHSSLHRFVSLSLSLSPLPLSLKIFIACTSKCASANIKFSVLTFKLFPTLLGFTFQLSNFVGPNLPTHPTFLGLILEYWKIEKL